MCVGCGCGKPKRELVRVVKSKDGEISIDTTGKKAGRGAYICHDAQCLQKAKKANRLNKAFSCKIDDEIYEKLMKELSE